MNQELLSLLGGKRVSSKSVSAPKSVRGKKGNNVPVLAKFVQSRFAIRGNYKGKLFKATVRSNGQIQFNGKLYHSPSGAGVAARKRSTNGWTFWKYKNRKGVWTKLSSLK